MGPYMLIHKLERTYPLMAIRLIAKDLYLLRQEVEKLERLLAESSKDQREGLERRLAKARLERDRVQRIFDGHKTVVQAERSRWRIQVGL